MRLELGPTTILVLSRRNLLTLLAKLDGFPENSACMIQGGSEALGIIVKAEEDSIHYADRPFGAMHDETEQAIGGMGL